MSALRYVTCCLLITLSGCAFNTSNQENNGILFMSGLQTDPRITATLDSLEQRPGLKDELFRYAFSPDSNASFQSIYDWLQKKVYLENARDMRYLAAMSYLAQRGRRNDIAAQTYIFAMFQAKAEAARCVDAAPANRRVELMQSQLREIEAIVFAQPRAVRSKNIDLAIERQQDTEKSEPAYALCQPFNSGLSNLPVNKSLVLPNDLSVRLPDLIKKFKDYYLK